MLCFSGPIPVPETFDTVTVTAALVALFPAASRATAVRTWLPFGTVELFQETE